MVTAVYCVAAQVNSNNDGTAGVKTIDMGIAPEAEWKLQDVAEFAAGVREAASVVVFEGLPHPVLAEKLYQREAKRHDLISIHGYPFYARPLNVPAETIDQIRAILLNPAAHLQFPELMPSELCGGYHPDYAVVWLNGGKQYGSLICFGCREWKNFTPDQLLYGRISHEAFTKLSGILDGYHGQRPEPFTVTHVSTRSPSDEMRALLGRIRERGILLKLSELERASVRDVESSPQVEMAAISPTGMSIWDSLFGKPAQLSVPEAPKAEPEDELFVARETFGHVYWIIRNIDSAAFFSQ